MRKMLATLTENFCPAFDMEGEDKDSLGTNELFNLLSFYHIKDAVQESLVPRANEMLLA